MHIIFLFLIDNGRTHSCQCLEASICEERATGHLERLQLDRVLCEGQEAEISKVGAITEAEIPQLRTVLCQRRY